MIGCQIAVGTSAVVYDIKRDVIANTIWQVPNSGLRFKLSGGYMWGDQAFEFASGNHQIGLEQYSYGLNTTWIIRRTGRRAVSTPSGERLGRTGQPGDASRCGLLHAGDRFRLPFLP